MAVPREIPLEMSDNRAVHHIFAAFKLVPLKVHILAFPTVQTDHPWPPPRRRPGMVYNRRGPVGFALPCCTFLFRLQVQGLPLSYGVAPIAYLARAV